MKGFSKWKEESSSHNINNNMLLIGMSANASTEDQNEAFEAGMHFFASKPVSVDFINLLMKTVKMRDFVLCEIVSSMSKSIRLDMETFSSNSCFVRENKMNRMYRTGNVSSNRAKRSFISKAFCGCLGWT